MQQHPFATLVSQTQGRPTISHLPFFWTDHGDGGLLTSHMARANPHWEAFASTPAVTTIFQGPHAYISPAWYPPAATNVPTWNYTAVHAHGTARIIEDRKEAWKHMEQMVHWNEAKYGKGWTPEPTALESKLAHIVVFQVEIQQLEGKFKLSQQQNAAARDGVAQALLVSHREADRDTGRLMRGTTESVRGDFTLTSDKSAMQVDVVHAFLKRSYWAANRTRETVVKSINNALSFGVFTQGRQVAFARVVTDYCTFAYLCDVFVDEDFRGQGLSKWMMESILGDPRLQSLRRFVLATQDAHSLYTRYGFQPLSEEESRRFMGIRNDAV